MIALYIILGIIAFITILLFIPACVYLEYKDDLTIIVRYAFLKFNIIKLLDKEDKPKEKSSKKKSSSKFKIIKQKIKNIVDKRGVEGFLELISTCANIATGSLVGLLSVLRISDLDIYYRVASTDADKAAKSYGTVCQIIYPTVSLIMILTKSKKPAITVDMDYTSDESLVIASAQIQALPMFVLVEIIKIIKKVVPVAVQLKKEGI